MPKSSKKRTEGRTAERLELSVIDPEEFTSREGVRRFVRSPRYAELARAIGAAASTWDGGEIDIEEAGRNIARILSDDLLALATAAASENCVPLAVARSDVFGEYVKDCGENLAEVLVGLLELGRALATADHYQDAAGEVLLLATNIASKIGHNAREAA